MNILHLINNSLPYQDGYAVRSHYVLRFQRDMGYSVTGITLPGVQSRMLGKIGLQVNEIDSIDGVPYYHFSDKQQSIVRWAKRLFSLRTLQPFKSRASAVYHVPDSGSKGMFASIVGSHRRKALVHYYEPVAQSLQPLDLLHAHWPPLNAYYALALARRLNVPVIYEIRSLFEDSLVAAGEIDMDSDIYQRRRRADTEAAQQVDELVAISEHLKRDFVKRGIPECKISVVPNGVDVNSLVPMSRDGELAQRYQLGDALTVGYIGSLFKYEGLSYLLRALPYIRRDIPNVVCVIVGDGPELGVLRDLAEALGLRSSVRFLGRVPVSEVQRYYSLLDVFVIPRLDLRVTQLTTPLKPYEAMAMEKALLVSRVGGLTEIVQDGETGVHFTAENVEDLTQKAKCLLKDAQLRSCLGKQARAWVVREHDWRVVVEQYASVYEKALQCTKN